MNLALALQRAWLRRGPLARALWPASLVFATLAALRRLAYRTGLARSQTVAAPVVVVGNVVAGGAGKTPIVMALVRHLQARGLQPGVVSRGHGRRTSDCREVRPDSAAADVGDEPLLVARETRAPVFVAASRVQAARALLAAHPGCRVIVSDDGLQHYRMRRDLEVCVFDDRGAGNGWLLPAGPLREPWPRPVDFVLRTAGAARIGGFEVRRRLAAAARRADGTPAALAALAGRPLTALAGVGQPQAFFDMLRRQGLHLERAIALPDHYDFGTLPDGLDAAELVCTEKDAVKLWRRRPDAWAVGLLVDVEPAFWTAFDRALDAKLSSTHGPETS
ncbi:tetraacyldisaccharide 4'-kinase [Ramlibacter sp.]|uniref:tetraacyldisaccharide 4'-kinase n=1 Tax=Ramlibacter sp. TaxID=1917967 RepID=UPI002B650260|nr:tetraacyldisaccharide 4'-kinase [Ramlibacter sp.]HWI81474.1 tetraacyldisaccharide 4'-kinase [Ramlibacter sp.]